MLLILNDIGGLEILLILVIILVFFGSKSIPSLAKTFGRTIRQVKEATEDIKSEIKKSTDEMKGDLDLKGLIKETSDDVRRPLDQYAQDIDNAVKYNPPRRVVVEVEEAEVHPKLVEGEPVKGEAAPIEQVKPTPEPIIEKVAKAEPKVDNLSSEEEK